MPASVVVGLQWGDEGKGKTTDFLSEQVRGHIILGAVREGPF